MTFTLIFSVIFGFIVGAFQMRGLFTHTPRTSKWPWQKKGYSLNNFYLQKKWDLLGICLCVELLKPSILYGLFLVVAKDTAIAEAIAIGTCAGQFIALNTKKQTLLSVIPTVSVLIALAPVIGISLCAIFGVLFHIRRNKFTASIVVLFCSIVFIILTHIQEDFALYVLTITSAILALSTRQLVNYTSWVKH